MTQRSARKPGFTLLEVLIAVVVLAFGLLGVVAVFPAVIDVQRRSQDAVLGGSLAASAEALLNSSVLESETLDWYDWESETSPGVRRFPPSEVLSNDVSISALGPPQGPADDQVVRLDFLWDSVEVDDEGVLVLGGTGRNAAVPFRFSDVDRTTPVSGSQALPEIEFPVSQRLLPDEASGDEPRYIWDVLVRRVDVGIGLALNDARSEVEVPLARLPELPVELMVIVRPVDRGIRVPVGLTLRDTLRGYELAPGPGGAIVRDPLSEIDRRFPVSAADSDLATPQPGARLNDSSQYSLPIFGRRVGSAPTEPVSQFAFGSGPKQVDFRQRRPGTPPVLVNTRNAQREFAKVGQIFVSDRGIVHRVTRVASDADDEDEIRVSFEPPITPGWRQIVFTPQVPADIRVIRAR
ncbi:MAG: prepilin-type N-terminal cleavage/methylation domain-containing protein [Planctomycetota bacterium]